MREIKFRAWYNDEMYEIFAMNFSDNKCVINSPRFPFSQEVYPDDIMQYTGLKDKNGKEIYEGDICKGVYAGSDEREYKNKIVWDEFECCFTFADSPLWTWEMIEIIGNIYENPELLK